MKIKPKKLYSRLNTPSIISMGILLILVSYRIFINDDQCFLILNKLNSLWLDLLFKYLTNLGDGLIWIILFCYTYFYHKKKTAIVFINFIISTLFANLLKRLIFADSLRPIQLINKGYHLHLVDGVNVHTNYSFPSGHTITAFAIAFTLIVMFKKKTFIKTLVVLIAFLVGFSRVYLVQHYPIDVIAGALIGVLSTYLTIYSLSLFKKGKEITLLNPI